MYQVLIDSLPIIGGHSPFKFDRETRVRNADQIFNQQSDELIIEDCPSCSCKNEPTLDEAQ